MGAHGQYYRPRPHAEQARDLRGYLARTQPDTDVGDCRMRTARTRPGPPLLAQVDLDAPPEAMQPIVDHLVERVLAEWDPEVATAPPGPSEAAQPNEP
ncbi:hypothetical protein Vau01_052200 [Virgisporangium aurantiacum]|uniref:Uncharacterized protein n=1 Tax=Virgisporangium aurantiacum TaxID=175570 RepID=A0A8J3Z5I2_9ACTN|nr:hypothetical protein Vau01_052200 [Virgisporangium aurantiacum]